MNEAHALTAVKEFHETFDLPVIDSPEFPSEQRIQLRINLLREELQELEEALEQRDMVETADALADLQYVLSGAIHEFGLGAAFPQIFNEVHRSNMSKVCHTKKIADSTADHYGKQGFKSHIVPKGNGYIVYREGDGKVLKSIEYSPADIESQLPSGPWQDQ